MRPVLLLFLSPLPIGCLSCLMFEVMASELFVTTVKYQAVINNNGEVTVPFAFDDVISYADGWSATDDVPDFDGAFVTLL